MKTWILWAFTLALSVLVGPNVASEEGAHQDSIRRRQVVIPAREFDFPEIENRFRAYLSSTSSATRVLQLEVMDRDKSMVLSAMGYTDITYPLWRVLFEDYEKEIPPFAELVALNGNAAMRLRDSRGNVVVKVLKGQNPYVLSACGAELSVVHLAVTRTGSVGRPNKKSVGLRFFVVTNLSVDETIAKCALHAIQEMKLTENIGVSVRNDPWFLQESNFPVVSPFLTEIHPPSAQEYEKAPQWNCISDERRTQCFGWSHLAPD